MDRLRALLLSRRHAALWLIVVVLAVRALVPQGFMVAPGSLFALTPCPQVTARAAAPMAHHAMAGDAAGHGSDQSDPRQHGDGVCAFAPLGHAATAAADPILLVAAIAFILAIGLSRRPRPPLVRRVAFLHPPLRGPPATT